MPIDLVIRNYEGNEERILDEVIDKLWLAKLRAGIPIIVGVVAKSSHGKSAFVILCQQKIYQKLGLNYLDYVGENVLIRPVDYAPKVRKVLTDPTLKSIVTIQMDEAKFLLNSDNWQSFKNKATRTITSTCRTIKPMIFFILAQRRKDIDPKTRDTLDYYIELVRHAKGAPQVEIFEVYESGDFSSPVIDRRPITIRMENNSGDSETIMPKFHPSMPNKDIWDKYKAIEEPAKYGEIMNILDEMERDAQKLTKETSSKIKEYVDFVKNNPAELEKVWKTTKTGGKLDKKVIGRMGYSTSDIKKIEELILTSLGSFEKGGESNADELQSVQTE
jgi:hypothetical protein